MYILGISAYYHDSAAALIKDGRIVAAAQEERFTRKKHDYRFPGHAVNFCLEYEGIKISDVDLVAFYDKPFLKFERLLETYLTFAPKGITSFLSAMPVWIKEKLWIKEQIKERLNYDGKILFPEHHQSHAASAFFPSPFKEAAFLTIDGVGEWTTTSYGIGKENKITILADIKFPHSIGMLYSAFTYYTGFKVNSGEYKVMGLAPYGTPKYVDLIYDNLIDLKDDGSFRLNMDYFNYCTGLTMTNSKFDKLFGGKPRKPESKLTQREMDLAASVQVVIEEVILRMARHIKNETNMKNLCLAGGVALNCVANGKLLRENIFDDIWIQPAAGDAGGALGAALFGWYQYLNNDRNVDEVNDSQNGSLLGPRFDNEYIEDYLKKNNIPFQKLSDEEIIDKTAELISQGNVVGWFRGRMEYGPRALGARSILGDARDPSMQKNMNLKIKFRESFRPFAPSVLEEKATEFFNIDRPSPYMLLVADVKEEKRVNHTADGNLFGIDKLNVIRSVIPAVTHVDYSARIQTVDKKRNPDYYKLISKFEELTGCPVIVNTSFNVRGEPIVRTPEEAYRCFMRTNIDFLVLENFLLDKKDQPEFKEQNDWRKEFELD
ncbi:carbamoyltransferase family protein [Melioribacter sp. OK-6-Me]|uniref:carbamoyltransferase family protein n=1 Tax=unclassified Melioribacter TaxID=2627329 RepID=UPI003ED85D2A